MDRAHFKPPEDANYPAWSDPGDVHRGLHWDVDTSESHWPIPFAVQGVVYLEDTPAHLGALRVVPAFHRHFQDWSKAQPKTRDGENFPMSPSDIHTGGSAGAFDDRGEGGAPPEAQADFTAGFNPVPVEGKAGDLVIWHVLLPHGPGRNLGSAPRVSAYVTMLPVDAGPFLGPGRDPRTPLFQNDAGTLDFFDADKAMGLQRMNRSTHVHRWRNRLPLLAEDPREDELPRRPPGEAHGRPASLTELGELLVGVREWPAPEMGFEERWDTPVLSCDNDNDAAETSEASTSGGEFGFTATSHSHVTGSSSETPG